MYNRERKRSFTGLNINQTVEGEPIEIKMAKLLSSDMGIEKHNTAKTIYMERGAGVMAGTDPRTDRFEVALDAMDAVSKSRIARRDSEGSKLKAEKGGLSDEAESTGTDTVK